VEPRRAVAKKTPDFRYFPLIGWEHFPTVPKPRKKPGKCCLMCYFDGFLSQRGSFKHHAIDINGTIGTPCVAVTSGIGWQWQKRPEGDNGEYTYWKTGGGWHYYLLGDDGFIYYYAHMDQKPVVKVGERVKAGQYIGPLGRTGNAGTTCPHNHFAMYATAMKPHKVRRSEIGSIIKGKAVNPFPYLNKTRAAATGKRPIKPGQTVGGSGTAVKVITGGVVATAAGFLILRALKARKESRGSNLSGFPRSQGRGSTRGKSSGLLVPSSSREMFT